MDGHIGEIVVFPSALSSTDLGLMQGYLNAKHFVPEPSAGVLLLLGGLTLVGRRRHGR